MARKSMKKTTAKARRRKSSRKSAKGAARTKSRSLKSRAGKKKKTKRSKGDEALGEALREHIRTKGPEYLAAEGVTSVGVARDDKGDPYLLFTVEEMSAAELESVFEKKIPVSVEIGGVTVKTDVKKRTYRPSFDIVEPETLGARRLRVDPIRPGISVANASATAGTLGLVVYDRETGAPCILSNWHVLHGNKGEIDSKIVQPGPFDDNNLSGNSCGNLLRSHLGAAGDCALARIRGREFDTAILGLDVTPTKMARVEIGDRLVKSGRTTEVTYGVVRRVDVMAKINYGFPAGAQVIGGFEIGPDPDLEKRPAEGEISKPGDSGSAWLIAKGKKATEIFAGLHFAGEASSSEDEHALACYPLSVQKKLDFLLEPPIDPLPGDAPRPEAVARTGYDADFLGKHVPTPEMPKSIKQDAHTFGRSKLIPYTHFSVCLSESRRMARFVAWNIDGARQVTLPRRGFKLDPRIDPKFQIGDELYADNKLDRGHIARRADLCWGPVAEADQANRDSFFFTNIAPQHQRFNQSDRKGLWGLLENLVLQQVDVQNIRVSAIGGPTFTDDDLYYRDAWRIPTDYWKLVAYVGGDSRLRAAAFVLSQADLLDDLEALDFDPFRLFQVTVDDLSTRTGLDFSALHRADVIANPDLAMVETEISRREVEGMRVVEIRGPGDVVF